MTMIRVPGRLGGTWRLPAFLICTLGLWVAMTAGAGSADPVRKEQLPIAAGPFEPTTNSLKTYQYPEWFRDAKLGMWAHWGPQAVPMFGDWYARQLYQQGGAQYKDHLEHYGHPTKVGHKDLIPLWKAEKWDPDRLMGLYKKAGARYFVSMGVHHDNFDLWNSTHHRWNAVQMGPHRDVVGDWQKAAKRLGLRFGVSEHLGASFTWFQDSHRSDKTGPLAGVPYDGADPKYQDLYHWPAAPDDKGWYSKDPRWQLEWFARIKDLVDQYHPDLLYTDGGAPFGNEVGLSMIAHLYNSSASRNHGKTDVVYTCKQNSEGMWVEDLERGVMPGIRPFPWQTDTSIGDWYYNRNWKYRGADWVIPHACRYRQQEWEPADECRAAPRRQPRPRGRAGARRDGRLDCDQWRGNLWNTSLADSRRGPRPRQGGPFQGRFRLHRQGPSLHEQRREYTLRLCAGLAGRDAGW